MWFFQVQLYVFDTGIGNFQAGSSAICIFIIAVINEKVACAKVVGYTCTQGLQVGVSCIWFCFMGERGRRVFSHSFDLSFTLWALACAFLRMRSTINNTLFNSYHCFYRFTTKQHWNADIINHFKDFCLSWQTTLSSFQVIFTSLNYSWNLTKL